MRGPEHRRRTRAFLGYDHPGIHALMDDAARQLGGRHRVVGHDLAALRAIAAIYGPTGRRVWAVHLLQDTGVLR